MTTSTPLRRSLIRLSGVLLVSLLAISGQPVIDRAYAAPDEPPPAIEITTPVVTGTTKVGKVLRGSVKSTGEVKPQFSYRWLRDGESIGGATDAKYRLKPKDRGHRISLRVVAKKDGHTSIEKTSKATARIAKGKFVLYKPKLSGSKRAGGVLKAKARTKGAVKPKLKYRWYRDGKRIGGAHKKNYRLKKKDRGHRIRVEVIATASGYQTVKKLSKKSSKIKPRLIDDAKSVHVVVNKHRPLKPKQYVPSGLVKPKGIYNQNGQPLKKSAARALERMHKAASRDGAGFYIISGYRSYSTQRSLYNSFVSSQGRARADVISARPGHSEHQTGLAVDLGASSSGCGLGECFASTKAGKWTKKNAWKYGFIVRYPKGKTHITGYVYEPWHFRYVGKTTAKNMKKKKIATLEQYRKLKAAPEYK